MLAAQSIRGRHWTLCGIVKVQDVGCIGLLYDVQQINSNKKRFTALCLARESSPLV